MFSVAGEAGVAGGGGGGGGRGFGRRHGACPCQCTNSLPALLPVRVQELCESRGGRQSWAVRPNEPYGFRGRKALQH